MLQSTYGKYKKNNLDHSVMKSRMDEFGVSGENYGIGV
jgi:hypothetical protein